tara:strand:- start:181 stop:360 length:180 start_codon:yes stop_codon:yes gene_type:complete
MRLVVDLVVQELQQVLMEHQLQEQVVEVLEDFKLGILEDLVDLVVEVLVEMEQLVHQEI